MYHLLAICLVLHPQCIDESIQQVLRDKNYHEKMFKMQMGDVQEFENCFLFACPKFLSATPPSVTDPSEATTDDYVKEAIKHQTQINDEVINKQSSFYVGVYIVIDLVYSSDEQLVTHNSPLWD
ncbi:hypothetical protein M8J76_002559 [Diaphorina citri]|nr:hypothetical protein M8J76_002559 [Diaphorina citri]